MCGISGIINKNNQPVKKEEIKKINDLIYHRGPDDEGYFFGKNFAFGHRRLAILDLSEAGHQPMEYEGKNGKYVIIHNGEIYNYIELRNELIKEGYKFKSNTDTEVILASYDKYREDCVNKFNGMWAFAIYDKEREIIFCSRDRFGIKPFYYTEIDNKFVFGSEIKQLLKFHKNNFVNKNVLIDYIVTSIQEHNNNTFFENIYKLEQSHNLIYDLKNHTYKINKYYEISFYKNNDTLEEAISKYENELKRAIDYRLRSDVKVGTCLSGGLDSSTVASIASKKYKKKSNQKFIAIHAKSIERETDESKYAKIASDVLDLELHIVEPTSEDFKKYLDEVVFTQEEPFGSPSIFMQYFVMKKAKEIGCTVMLDGQGGDETLLGYEKYFPSAYINIFKNEGIIETLKQIKKSKENNSKMSIDWIVKYIVGSLFSSMRKLEYKRRTSFMKRYDNKFSFLDNLSKSYYNINALQAYEIRYTNLPILLRYEDKNSMRHSIETRLPFIDYKTLECALNIDIKYKIKDGWTKYILRKILNKYLPDEVVWRKNKLGFNAPENVWMKDIYSEIKKEIKNSKILNKICNMNVLLNKLDKMDNRLKWRLYNVAVWERVYNVKISKKVANLVFNPFVNDSRVLKETVSLANNGYNVEVIAHLDDGLKKIQNEKKFTIRRFSYLNRKTTKNKFIKLIAYLRYIKKSVAYCKDFDIIHCNDLNTLPIGVIIKRFFNKNAKIVYDAHEYEINDKPNESEYSIKMKYYIEKFFIKYADKVITVSDSISNEYVRLYNIEKPALVLNTPSYKEIEKKDIFRKSLNIDKDKTIFLYQGGLSKGRGIEILLDTFKDINDDKIVIVFMGYGPLEEIIKEASKKYSNIYFHSAVSPEVLLDYTSSADFGILFYENSCLNHYYCAPNKMFEYLMAEIPVIVSNLYEMRKLIDKYKIGVVAKENSTKGLKEAIKEAMSLDRNELLENIKKVKKIYNWEEQERVLLKIYETL